MTKKLSIMLVTVIVLILVIVTSILFINGKDKDTNINNGEDSVYTFRATILQATQTSLLVEPEEREDIRKSSDKLNVNIYKIKDLPNFAEGDKVLISYDGTVMESYPAQIIANKIEKIGDTNNNAKEDSKKVGLFKALIDNIIKEDPALNEPLGFIAINFESILNPNKDNISDKDLIKYNEMYKLDENDKQEIIDHCRRYTSDIKDSNFDKLKQEGLFNEEQLYIENGILIYAGSIKKVKDNSIEIDFVKYRGGLGAIFPKYKATYEEGKWNLEIIEMAIA